MDEIFKVLLKRSKKKEWFFSVEIKYKEYEDLLDVDEDDFDVIILFDM